MNDDKLAVEEARRASQHEAVKGQVESEVQAEIAQRAEQAPAPREAQRIEQVAGDFRKQLMRSLTQSVRCNVQGVWREFPKLSITSFT